MKKTEPEYYPPVENLLDLIYEHYTENNPVEKNTVAGKAAKAKEKELEEWLRGLDGMDRLVDDYVGDKIAAFYDSLLFPSSMLLMCLFPTPHLKASSSCDKFFLTPKISDTLSKCSIINCHVWSSL